MKYLWYLNLIVDFSVAPTTTTFPEIYMLLPPPQGCEFTLCPPLVLLPSPLLIIIAQSLNPSSMELFENGIIYANDLLFDTDTADSFMIISSKIGKTKFLTWALLRHSVPSHLKTKESTPSEMSLLVTIDSKYFDVFKKKSKNYYTLIKNSRAKL